MSYQKLEPFDGKRTKFKGLWYNAKLHKFYSPVIDLSQIRQFKGVVRLMVMKNLYYNGGENGRPNYVFSFVDAKSENPQNLEIEPITVETTTMYCFSRDSLQHLINRVACYVGGDGEYGEHLVEDFVSGCGLETEVY